MHDVSPSPDLTHLVVFLLALADKLSLPANPAAPPAAEVLRYAPDDADVVVYLDVEAVLPRNYQAFVASGDDQLVRGTPGAREAHQRVVARLEAARGEVKSTAGVDPVRDLRSLALVLTVREQGDPDWLVSARGRFDAALLDRLAAEGGARKESVGSRTLVIAPGEKAAVTVTADGTVLAGSLSRVRERAGAWTPRRGPLLDKVTAALDERPFFFVGSRPSATALRVLERELRDPDVVWLRDFLVGHEAATLSLSWNGMGWSYLARSAAGHARAGLVSEGTVQILRAGSFYVRGLARWALAIAESYPNAPGVKTVLARKAELLRVVDASSGDASFSAKVDRQDAARRTSVKLTGRSFSEVVPAAGVLVPLAVAVAMLM